MFVQPYSHVMKQPDELLFTNTLSPITNITYDNCGDKLNGEDHIDVMFATNANKRLGFGFDLNYAYARGYYANQSTSHFGSTLFGSYDGDTMLGKRNDSLLAYLYNVARDSWDTEKKKWVFEGHDSWLWCLVLANMEDG